MLQETIQSILAENPLASIQQIAFALNKDEAAIQPSFDEAKAVQNVYDTMLGAGDDKRYFYPNCTESVFEFLFRENNEDTGIAVIMQKADRSEYSIQIWFADEKTFGNADELGYELGGGGMDDVYYMRVFHAPLTGQKALADCADLHEKAVIKEYA